MAYIESDPNRAAAAHVLRRMTMAAHPDALATLDSADDAVNFALDAEPIADTPPDDDWYGAAVWWVNQMLRPEAGIHERMTWTWHTILTSNGEASYSDHQVSDQLQLIRTHSLGNFRDLLQGFVTDGLLIAFLTADGSQASNPNENLGRELMELFSMGVGDPTNPNYTQEDVRAAARALAGWVIDQDPDDEDRSILRFERENSFIAPLIFLGEQRDWDTASVVDRICDHPATARRIASMLWTDFVGAPPSDAVATELGTWWAQNDLEIRPLVGRIVSSNEFLSARLNRPRTGLEWLVSAYASLDISAEDFWSLMGLGQAPYLPPNVGGWARDNRWLSVGSLSARSQAAWELTGNTPPPFVGSTDEAIHKLGLYTLSDSTIAAMAQVDNSVREFDRDTASLTRWRTALCAPEFNLA